MKRQWNPTWTRKKWPQRDRPGCLLLLLAGLCTPGCDSFGLPAYVPPPTPKPNLTGVGDILDISPKFGRAGESGLEVQIRGLQTSFNDRSQVLFPDESAIVVTSLEVDSISSLRVQLNIGAKAVLGVHRLQVVTPVDGIMEYEQGFTVVE